MMPLTTGEPIMIGINDTRLALGFGMAKKDMVV